MKPTFIASALVLASLCSGFAQKPKSTETELGSTLAYDSHNILKLPNMRVSINGGYARLTDYYEKGEDSEINTYIEDLRSGTGFGVDFSYFFKNVFGLGLEASVFASKVCPAELPVIVSGGTTYYGTFRNDVKVYSVGPQLFVRLLPLESRVHVNLSLGLAYVALSDDVTTTELVKSTMKLEEHNDLRTGEGLGYSSALSLDYFFAKKVAISIKGSYNACKLSSYKIDGADVSLTYGVYKNVARYSLSGGLSFVID